MITVLMTWKILKPKVVGIRLKDQIEIRKFLKQHLKFISLSDNKSMMISPKHSGKPLLGAVSNTSRPSKHRNKINRSMISTENDIGQFTSMNMKKYLKQKEKMNPMAAIEKDIENARMKLKYVDAIREKADNTDDEHTQLVLLNKENIILT